MLRVIYSCIFIPTSWILQWTIDLLIRARSTWQYLWNYFIKINFTLCKCYAWVKIRFGFSVRVFFSTTIFIWKSTFFTIDLCFHSFAVWLYYAVNKLYIVSLFHKRVYNYCHCKMFKLQILIMHTFNKSDTLAHITLHTCTHFYALFQNEKIH